ncbi:MAG: rhodanese-like domain-containing protein [candidate division Zixibacteria bacterium]|nr:rhodanese-like domain-containing protein [candidate division Zixibacteria bacterium]
MMKNWMVQIIVLLAVSTFAGVVLNAVRPDGISVVGNWPSRTSGDTAAIVPPSAIEGDPPFITLDDAVAKYQTPEVIFVDARSPEDFAYGHIVRAVNIPYDYLDDNWMGVIDSLDLQKEYVIYCSGGECEASLFLGRLLKDKGFGRLWVFYGGWQEWLDNRLPVTTPETSGGESGS